LEWETKSFLLIGKAYAKEEKIVNASAIRNERPSSMVIDPPTLHDDDGLLTT